MPRQAALAFWLFETTYAEPGLGPDELAAFGLFNQFHYHAVLMQPDMALAMNTNMTLNPYYTIIGQKIADGGVFTSANRPA